MLSDVMEDYLKAIYVLQTENGPPVSTSAIAERVGKTPPTVTSMLETLEERGLVEREKYKGTELTEEGRTVALEVLRHHRLLEAYLAEHLDYSWSEVHEEADALEHHISEEFERRVAAALGDPAVDPHGDPIPGADLEPPADDDARPLTEVAVGERVVIARVSDRDDEELEYLDRAGITPGTTVEVVDIAPFGMVTVAVEPVGESHGGDTGDDGDDREQSLPETIAAAVRVRPVEEVNGTAATDAGVGGA
ncbi:metal-dependent transcriptional regulator [Halobaculum magnesiiphilum]|uniref:Metal-dependent transcriptional regulator n=1 Tax=Halobaculum magnesiiphilum TaxID=1017351 RepID=A0A8T8WBJ6_9EURY|nr:metal-dependent transcriptional regulator [Halobaculum magnesiiphilum]QZP37196.1 metal-dependent transcriptional regulator [Halobaculum magnesiiphilum]